MPRILVVGGGYVGMYTALRSMHRWLPDKPVLITENGMPTDNAQPRADGVTRSENMRDTLYWVQRARQDGVPVIGYMYWSLTDNYEWGSYDARFGLYTVNIRTDPQLVRRPTAAAAAFRGLIAGRGVTDAFHPTDRSALADCSTASVAPPDRFTCRAAAGFAWANNWSCNSGIAWPGRTAIRARSANQARIGSPPSPADLQR